MMNRLKFDDQETLRIHRQDGAALAMVLFFVIVTSLWMMAVITLTQSSSSAIAQNTELSKVRSEVLSTGTEKALIALTKTEGESGCVTEDPDNLTAPCRFGTFINKCSDSARFSIPDFLVAGVTYEVKCAESSSSGYEYDSTGLYLMGPMLGESGGWNLDQDCSETNSCYTGRDGGLRVVTSGNGYSSSTNPICASSNGNERFTVVGNIVNLFGRWKDVDCTNFELKRPANLAAGKSVGIYTPLSGSNLCPAQSGVSIDVLNCIEPNALEWGGKVATSSKPRVGKIYSLSQNHLNRAYAVEKSAVLSNSSTNSTLVSNSSTISNISSSGVITTGTIEFSPSDLRKSLHPGIQLEVLKEVGNDKVEIEILSGNRLSGFQFRILRGVIGNGTTGRVTTDHATFELESPSCTNRGDGFGFTTDFTSGMKYIRVKPGKLTTIELSMINQLVNSGSGCGDGESGPGLIFDKGTYRIIGSTSKGRSSSNSIIIKNQDLIVWGGDFDSYRRNLPANQKQIFIGNPVCPSPTNLGRENVLGVKFEMSGYSYWWVQQGHLVLCASSKKVVFDDLPVVDSVFIAPRLQSYESFNSQRHFIWGGGSRNIQCSSSSGAGDCPIIELEQGSNVPGTSCSDVKNCMFIGGQIVVPGSWIDLDLNGSTVAVVEGGLMVRALTVSTTASGPPGRTVSANRWEYFGNRRVQLWFREKAPGRYLGSLQLEIIDTKTQLASGYRVLAWRTGW